MAAYLHQLLFNIEYLFDGAEVQASENHKRTHDYEIDSIYYYMNC